MKKFAFIILLLNCISIYSQNREDQKLFEDQLKREIVNSLFGNSNNNAPSVPGTNQYSNHEIPEGISGMIFFTDGRIKKFYDVLNIGATCGSFGSGSMDFVQDNKPAYLINFQDSWRFVDLTSIQKIYFNYILEYKGSCAKVRVTVDLKNGKNIMYTIDSLSSVIILKVNDDLTNVITNMPINIFVPGGDSQRQLINYIVFD